MNGQSNKKQTRKYLSLRELIDLPPEPTEPYTSSPWVFNEDAFTLELYEVTASGVKRWLYEVDLERCRTQAEIADWILHISEKTWATDHILASLVRDLRLYLGPKICFGPGTTDIRATIKKNISRANTLRGRPSKRVAQNDHYSSDQAS